MLQGHNRYIYIYTIYLKKHQSFKKKIKIKTTVKMDSTLALNIQTVCATGYAATMILAPQIYLENAGFTGIYVFIFMMFMLS